MAAATTGDENGRGDRASKQSTTALAGACNTDSPLPAVLKCARWGYTLHSRRIRISRINSEANPSAGTMESMT